MVSVRGRRRLVKRLPVGLRFLGPSVPRLPSLTLLLGPLFNPLLNALRPEFFYHLRREQYHCDSHLRRDSAANHH